jgi:ribose transport system substrate-binding protein
MPRRFLAAALALSAFVPLLTACGSSDSSGSSSTSAATTKAAAPVTAPSAPICETLGPNGETATPIAKFTLAPDELAKIKKGHYTAAMAWHTSDEVTAAETRGAQAAFKEMGIKVVAITNADYQADRQSDQVRTILAKKPDIIISLPVDPTATAAAFKQAAAAGVKLAFQDNAPNGFTKAGTNYVSVITSNHCEMGQKTADALAAAIGGKGDIGYIFHDADFYVTNHRDQAFKKTIEKNYPNIKIVAEQGISDPAQSETEANAMLTQHPNLKGIYVTFGEVAQGVLSALRNNGNTTAKVATMDLQEPLALDMARGGQTAAIAVEGLYDDGVALARATGLSLIGKTVPPFIVSATTTVTKANLAQGYENSEHTTPPKDVQDALGG